MKKKTFDQYLELIPSCNPKISFSLEGDSLEIQIKGFLNKAICWLFKKPKVIVMSLDELSLKAWNLMDGERTLKDITLLMQEFVPDDDLTTLAERTAHFFSLLKSKNFIRLK